MNPIKKANLEKGEKAENKYFNLFKRVFDSNLLKSKNKYDKFDFYSDYTLLELKSRNNEYKKYPTTMIGMNKILFGINSKKICYFVFEFTDGLYYWLMNEKDIEEFDIAKGGTTKRGEIEIKNYLYIPIEKLIKITDDEPPSPQQILINKLRTNTIFDCQIMDPNIYCDYGISKNLINMSMDC